MTERLVWIDCEMTGLDLEADALDRGRRPRHRLRPDRPRRGRRHRHQAAAAALEQMVAVRPRHAHQLGADRGARRRRHAGGGRGSRCSPTSRSTARRQPPAAGRQHRGHRPVVPDPRHARPRAVPALPHRRRVLDQGAPALVPARLLQRPGQGRQPPRARRHPREHRGARATTATRSSCLRPVRTAPRPSGSRPSTRARWPEQTRFGAR